MGICCLCGSALIPTLCPITPIRQGNIRKLIRPNQIRLSRRVLRMDAIRNLSCILLIWKLRIDSHPIPGRPRKLNHLRRRVAPQQILLQLHRIGLPRKRPNLHTPPPTRIGIHANRRGKCLHPHLRHTRAINPRSLRRSQRQVDNPSPHKRPPIRNLHHGRFVVRQIRHPHHRPQRQRQVRGSHRILVIHPPFPPLAPPTSLTIPSPPPPLSPN